MVSGCCAWRNHHGNGAGVQTPLAPAVGDGIGAEHKVDVADCVVHCEKRRYHCWLEVKGQTEGGDANGMHGVGTTEWRM